MKTNQTPPELLELLAYDENSPTGLIWIKSTSRRIRVGETAGSYFRVSKTAGYYRVKFQKKTYAVHRIIWEIINGLIPDGYYPDHKDLNTLNNKIKNLRLATHSDNLCNKSILKKNKYGVKGLNKQNEKWLGVICKDKQRYTFISEERKEVENWLFNKRNELHREFSRHN